MSILTGRDYCLQYPGYVLRKYGTGFFVAALLKHKTSLLALLNSHLAAHGYPVPGEVGRAYRVSALLEFRMAHFYAALAERFRTEPVAEALFRELSDEEIEHGRLMHLCRYTVTLGPRNRFVPRLRDPMVQALLYKLRDARRRLQSLTLDEALELAEQLERSEINTIFDRLLHQATNAAIEPFADALQMAGDHATTVAARTARLRRKLAA